MTREEAMQVLQLYRPWINDPKDAETTAALALADRDPQLRAWLEQHCELQRAICVSVRAQTPPEAFREQIISECLARRRAVSRRTWIATATAVLLAGVGVEAFLLFGNRPGNEDINFAAYEQRMSRDALRLYRMDLETQNLEEIRAFLASHQSPSNYVVPRAMAGVKATGCLATKWQGRPVSMICFHTGKPLEPGRTSDLFLFVIDQKAIPDAPDKTTPTFGQVNRLEVARWSADGNTYLLATERGAEELRKNL